MSTFKYVNTKSTDPHVRHEALIYLIRTFNEQGEYEKAEEAIHFLEKEKHAQYYSATIRVLLATHFINFNMYLFVEKQF